MRMTRKILTSFIFFIAFFFGGLVKASAQEFSYTEHNVEVNILESGDAVFKSSLVLTNRDNLDLISGYQYILPALKPTNLSVKLEGVEMPTNVFSADYDNYSILEINFLDNVVKFNEAKNLEIYAYIPNFVTRKLDSRYVMLSSSGDESDSFRVYFPKSFNEPVFVSNRGYSLKDLGQSYEMLFNPMRPTFIIWGSEYYIDVESRLTLNNTNENNAVAFTQLIPDKFFQTVFYKNINSGKFGLEDQLGNRYAYIDMPKSSKVDSGFEAKIYKQIGELSMVNQDKYNFELRKSNVFSEIIDRYKEFYDDNSYLKLKLIYNDLVKEYPIDFSTAPPYKDNESLWNEIDLKNTLNSYDYSVLLTSIIEELEGIAEIRYGYVVISNFDDEIIQPHFWVVGNLGSDTFLLDPYQQIISGLEYFGSKTDFDRITVGIWDKESGNFGSLGLISENIDNPVKKIKLVDLGDFISEEINLVDVSSHDKKDIYSGFFYSEEFLINNPSEEYIKIDNILLDGYELTLDFLPSNFHLGLLPRKNNEIIISNLRENNYFFSGEKQSIFSFVFSSENIDSIDISKNNKFSINWGIFSLAPLFLIVFPIIFVLYRKTWRR